ncbi:MAG: peptidoglycan-associated lipoprotein Pal [Gemmatimonadota bacterium]|nr:peptidoglycan-associated lipoprotein Pal [Gemmatimonadota bacterium]
MIVRRFVLSVLVATFVAGSCGGDPPPPPPEPPQQDQDSLQRYRDSVAAAQREAEAAAARAAADSAAAAERERLVREMRETLEARVYFDYDESRIRPEAETLLQEKAQILRASPQVRITIEGHADERGSTEYNLALGNRRAEAVREFLTDFGISDNRFETVSFGEGRPLRTGSNEEAWAANRRAEFVITAGGNQINPPN